MVAINFGGYFWCSVAIIRRLNLVGFAITLDRCGAHLGTKGHWRVHRSDSSWNIEMSKED